MAETRTPTPTLLWQQVRYQNTLFWRTPVAAFFTLVFPLMFLVLFSLLFGDEMIEIEGRDPLSIAQFFAPALAGFAAASATYTNIGVGQAIARDERILKRIRATPLPPWIYLGGVVGSAVWMAFIAVAIMMTVGALAYDVEIMLDTLPAALLTFVVGVSCFAALGLALAGFSPTGDTAPAVANATLLPIAFISDVFIPISDPPRWLEFFGDLFPLKHFVRGLQDAFSPFTTDLAFRWGDLANMAVWTVIGTLLALRFFVWEPHADRETKRASRGLRKRTAED